MCSEALGYCSLTGAGAPAGELGGMAVRVC